MSISTECPKFEDKFKKLDLIKRIVSLNINSIIYDKLLHIKINNIQESDISKMMYHLTLQSEILNSTIDNLVTKETPIINDDRIKEIVEDEFIPLLKTDHFTVCACDKPYKHDDMFPAKNIYVINHEKLETIRLGE